MFKIVGDFFNDTRWKLALTLPERFFDLAFDILPEFVSSQ
jgi:hypothetical protein